MRQRRALLAAAALLSSVTCGEDDLTQRRVRRHEGCRSHVARAGLRPALVVTRVANTSTPSGTACLYSRTRVTQPARSAGLAMCPWQPLIQLSPPHARANRGQLRHAFLCG